VVSKLPIALYQYTNKKIKKQAPYDSLSFRDPVRRQWKAFRNRLNIVLGVKAVNKYLLFLKMHLVAEIFRRSIRPFFPIRFDYRESGLYLSS